MEFTYSAYINMLKNLKDNGYSIADYHNCDSFRKCAILRHDVDTDLRKAVKMAELEENEGVRATYFILLSSDLYNVFSRKNERRIRQIKSQGHDIGLHFDEAKYSFTDDASIKNAIMKEITIMENMLNFKVKSISMHRPSKLTLEADYHFDNVVNSYGNRFFREFKYVSDSRRNWRENIDEIISKGDYSKLHILTHPFWYNDDTSNVNSIGDALKTFIKRGNTDRYEILKKNITDIESVIDKGKI